VIGAFVGATVVALMQYVRVRDWRVLLLACAFALQAYSLSREWWDVWKDVSEGAVCLSGLVLVLSFSPRHEREKGPSTPPSRHDG
jgi:hypothetical protein